MKILFLSRWFPWPTNNGSKLRIYHLLRGLAEHHAVTLLSFADQADVDSQAPEVQALCQAVHVVPWQAYTPENLRARLGYLRLAPRSVVDTFSPAMAERVAHLMATEHFDLVIASQLDAAGYGRYFQGRAALYEEVEIGTIYDQFTGAHSTRQRLRHGLTWLKHRRYLRQQLRYFQACTVASSRERDLVAQAAPRYNTIAVVPNCINTAEYQPATTIERNTLIFTGPFGYRANYEAMRWFLAEVYPRIQVAIPDIRLTITGDHRNLPLPTSANVTLTGFVDDVRPLVAQSWISLAPLHSGGGTRLKILEAMALGTPVVATTKGAEGLDAQAGQDLLLADNPAAFADAIIRLCRDANLRRQLTQNAARLVQTKYDWSATMPSFLQLVEEVGTA